MEMYSPFNIDKIDQYPYIRIPIDIYTSDKFKHLSDGAKLLYGIIYNSLVLSIENGWHDEEFNIYTIYKTTQIMVDLNCSRQKAVKLLKELETIGLIRRVKQSVGYPNLIYVDYDYINGHTNYPWSFKQ